MKSLSPFAIAIALTLFVAALLFGTERADLVALRILLDWRLSTAWIEPLAIGVTMAGSAMVLIPATLAVALWLLVRRRGNAAIFLIVTAFGGRIAVELLKQVIDRPRPDLAPFPVTVTSSSFPSGHAANSMVTFLALALVIVPADRRTPALAAAVIASFAVGFTRPLLGVHWPSDVVAGWLFGILWVVFCRRLVSRDGTGA